MHLKDGFFIEVMNTVVSGPYEQVLFCKVLTVSVLCNWGSSEILHQRRVILNFLLIRGIGSILNHLKNSYFAQV